MPIAVINGASFGAWRNGRYAMRSTATLIEPQKAIVATITATSTSHAENEESVTPSHWFSRCMPNTEPSMNRSPWAKLISSMMP